MGSGASKFRYETTSLDSHSLNDVNDAIAHLRNHLMDADVQMEGCKTIGELAAKKENIGTFPAVAYFFGCKVGV